MYKPTTLSEVKEVVIELISLLLLVIFGIKVVIHELDGLWSMFIH